MTNVKRVALSLAMAVLTAVVLHGSAMARTDKKGGDDEEAMRAKVRDKIRTFRAARLVEVLDLDEKTAAKLFPLLNKYDDAIMPLQADNGKARRELRALVDAGGKVDDTKVNAIIDRVLANRAKIAKLEDDRIKDIRKLLAPTQAAKLIIALPVIDREIEMRIRKALKGKRGGKRGGGGGGGGGGGLDDDDVE